MLKNLYIHDLCPICKSVSLFEIGKKKTINQNSDFKVSIIKCLECFHWHTSPSPNQETLNELHKDESPYVLGIKWSNYKRERKIINSMASNNHWIVRELSNYKHGNYLEIGTGSGELIRKTQSLGWNSYGVDPGDYASGFQIVKNSSELPRQIKFDVIVFKDVLEHTFDPNIILKIYKNYLKPNAIMFITVPWNESKAANIRKLNWEMVKPLGHLHYFSKNSLNILLNNNGFKIKNQFTVNVYRSYWKLLLTTPISLIYLMLRPSKWWLIKERINQLKTLIMIFPGDKHGDQLYIKAIKI